MNFKLDPVYYYSKRGVGEVTRQVFKHLKIHGNTSLLLNSMSPTIAEKIMSVPFYFLIWEQLILPILLKYKQVDIYFATGGTAPVYIPEDIKFYLWVHDLIYLEDIFKKATMRQKLGAFYRKTLAKRNLKRADKIIVISDETRKILLLNFPKFRNKVQLIPNIVEVPSNAAHIKDIDFLIFAHKGVNKNQKIIIQLIKLLSLRTSPIQNHSFVFIGIEKNMIDSKCDTSVSMKFIKYLPKKEYYSIISRSKVVIIPSLSEGFGLPAAQASLLRCNLILSDINIFKEVAPFSLFFNPLDIRDLISKILQLTDSKFCQHGNLYLTQNRNKKGLTSIQHLICN